MHQLQRVVLLLVRNCNLSLLSLQQPAFLPRPVVSTRYIETGLYEGDSFAVALRAPFKRLDGIEFSSKYVQHCQGRFQDPRVRISQGSSIGWLKLLLEDVPTTFWLDAHFTGDPLRPELMSPAIGECPLLGELQIIAAFLWTERPVIMIDDLHMFQPPFWVTPEARNFTRTHWPTYDDIVRVLADYQVVPHRGVLYAF